MILRDELEYEFPLGTLGETAHRMGGAWQSRSTFVLSPHTDERTARTNVTSQIGEILYRSEKGVL
jgi:hypothetical protein